jgi:hypothetical protein
MKRMTLLAMVFLAGCWDTTPKPAAGALAPDITLDAGKTATLDQARRACPGLDEYAPDLRVVEISASAVTFEVPDNPAKVPDTLNAWGNRCEIVLDGERATTSKVACASVCQRKAHTGDGPPYALN